MNLLELATIIGCLCWFILTLRKDVRRGLCVGVTIFVILPHQVKLELSGPADFTIQRLMLIGLLPFLPRLWRDSPGWGGVPFLRGLLAVAAAQLVSMVFSVWFTASLKGFLSFTFEIIVFYAIISVSIRDWEDVTNLIRAICRGLVIVAILAFVEKYSSISIFRALSGMQVKSALGVTATYPHRILLGYAMAMAIPLLLVLIDWSKPGRPRLLAWTALFAAVAACYFSTSRGPWMGAILASVGMMIMAGRASARRLIVLFVLAVVVMIVRPGVWGTISGLSKQSFESDTLKGRSYEYRWILWHVAWSEITKSPVRLVFGYGGHSTESMDLGHYFAKESGGTAVTIGFTSWDNNLACDLIEFGVAGFMIEIVLYISVMKTLLLAWWRTDMEKRQLLAAIIGAAGIYLFALTNVYIFSPQLNYLFWTLVAVGIGATRLVPDKEGGSSGEPDSGDGNPMNILFHADARDAGV